MDSALYDRLLLHQRQTLLSDQLATRLSDVEPLLIGASNSASSPVVPIATTLHTVFTASAAGSIRPFRRGEKVMLIWALPLVGARAPGGERYSSRFGLQASTRWARQR